MKVYFGFTVAGDRSTVETARSMVACLEDLGHEVLTRHLVSDDARAADRLLGPQAVYQRDMAWLRECDLFAAEVPGSSFGPTGRRKRSSDVVSENTITCHPAARAFFAKSIASGSLDRSR